MTRDGYSNFSFLKALTPGDQSAGAAVDGETIDLTGFETCVFVVNNGTDTGGGAYSVDNVHAFLLEHADASSGDNPDTFVAINSTHVLRGVSTAMVSGVFASIDSQTGTNSIFQVGYIGPKRFVRLVYSGAGLPSLLSVGAVAILGLPHDWPVNTVG